MAMVLKFHAIAKYSKNMPTLWKYQDRDQLQRLKDDFQDSPWAV